MRYLKMLAIAAVAAMALTAFVGAGSASATVLCKTAIKEGCAESGWAYPVGTVVDLSLTGTTVTETTGGILADTCLQGTLKGETTNAGSSSETVDWNVSEMWSRECSRITTPLANGSLEVEWIPGTNNGTLIGRNTEVTKNTIFGTCNYGTVAGGNYYGTVNGGNPATVSTEAVFPKLAGNATCPADVRWTGSYAIPSPEPLYIAKN